MIYYEDESPAERLLSAEDVAKVLGISPRTVLAMGIKNLRLGRRTIRFRLRDVYQHLGIATPSERQGASVKNRPADDETTGTHDIIDADSQERE